MLSQSGQYKAAHLVTANDKYYTCSKGLDEDIRALAHGPDDGHALGPLQVERDRPLPPGEHVRLVSGAAFSIQNCREITSVSRI